MNKVTFFVLLFAMTLCCCKIKLNTVEGNGNVGSENRAIKNVSKIKLKGGLNITLVNGLESAKIEADENLIPYIITETEDDWLVASIKPGYQLKSSNPINLIVSLPTLTEVELSGSGDIIGQGRFSNTNNIQVKLSGSGKIELDVNAPEVFTKISGSGSITLTGETKTIHSGIVGSGDIFTQNLKAENAEASITGSGTIKLFAENLLQAKLTGSGNIYYTGNAKVEKKITGSGEVIKEP